MARKIRDELGRTIAPVALTGYERIEDQAATHLAGFDWHLVMPIDIVQLTAILGQ
jgi:CheY-like chemotaxis protein